MKLRVLIILSVFSLAQVSLFAQGGLDKDTQRIKEVELYGIKNKEKDLLKSQRIDSATIADHQASTLTDLLSQTCIYVKNYGNSMLATPGFRGTAGDHTKLYWNGIPLNSSMYGVQDLNLVPAFLADEVEIGFGGASLANGSGGFGGSINLGTHIRPGPDKISLFSTIGSFGEYKEGLALNYGKGRLWSGTKIYYSTSRNNFPYINSFSWNSPLETEQDASMHQYGIMQLFDWYFSKKNVLKAAAWYQNSYRNLPQTMISNANHEYQKDESFRSNISYRHYESRYQWNLDAGYVQEYLFYHNELAGINSPANNSRYTLKGSITSQFLSALNLKAGLEDVEETVQIKEYQGAKMRNVSGIWADGSYELSKKWMTGLVARIGSVNFSTPQLAFTGSVAFKTPGDNRLIIHLNGGHNFNYPNLNDLYWYPGGNPDLQPEKTWQAECGVSSSIRFGKSILFEPELTIFSNWIDDYILWTPAGGSIWQAQNLKKVWARGIESAVNLTRKIKPGTLTLKLSYQYTPSTNENLIPLYDQNMGSQLIYIPKHTGQGLWRIQAGKYEFTCEYTYTGARNTTARELPGYSLVNIFAGRQFNFDKFKLNVLLKCNNVFNENYQAIIWRPMPGRWFEVNLRISLLGY